jgi:septal ring factor EnvC (AmiA/AmiB activator)
MNFFQKGLAGLESRLDKVLLDESDQAAMQREKEAKERAAQVERERLAALEKEKSATPPPPVERAESPVPRGSSDRGRGRSSLFAFGPLEAS